VRHTFPPLWAVPLLLIAALIGIVYVTLAFPLLALAPGVLAIVWLQRKADAYVRLRQANI
jgi:hypothetical protein